MTNPYPLTLVTPPSEEPVSVSRMKAHLRVDHEADDDYIGELIASARDHIERRLGQALVMRTYRLDLPGWPPGSFSGRLLDQALVWRDYRTDLSTALPGWPRGWRPGAFEFPMPPLVSVDSIKYDDPSGDEQTLDADNYTVITTSVPGRIEWNNAFVAPPLFAGDYPLRITFTAGHGAAESVTPSVKHAVRLLVGHWYENREEVVIGGGSAAEIPHGVERLIYSAWHGSY